MRLAQGNGTEHAYMTTRQACRICDMPRGLQATGADLVPGYPNPRAEFREGGPQGNHWYHGTDVDFSSPLKPTERDYGHASTNDTHWNTDLGVHFTSMHDVARDFARNFAGTDSATPEHARVAHVELHMKNPKDFENEHELADYGIATARKHGLHYGETDDPELQDINDGYEDEVSLSKKDHWLSSHPDRQKIVHHVEHDLKDQGHDGILYGNSYEGPPHTSAIAFRDTPVTIHRWEYLHEGHPEHGKEAHVREAGKGKPRHNAPHVDRRADQEGQGRPEDVASDRGGQVQAPLKALVEHPRVGSDLKKLPRQIQNVYQSRVDDLRRGDPHSSTHPLNGPLKGWNATSLNFQYRMVHRHVGDELHVLSAGNHDESYDQGIRRKTSIRMVPPEEYAKFSFPDYPRARTPESLAKHFRKTSPEYFDKIKNDVAQNGFTTPVLVRWKDGGGRPLKKPQVMEGHHRAAVAHELGVHLPVGDYDDMADYDVAAKNGQQWFRDNVRPTGDMPGKEGRYVAPHDRLFGPTYGLDNRLFEDGKLKQSIRHDIMATFDAFCARHRYQGHERWSKIVFFGSEASTWTSPDLHGNNDFDLSIGLEYDLMRRDNPAMASLSDQEIATGLTEIMHAELNDPQKTYPGVEGVFDQTWFANLLGWRIELIKPYAAYDVVAQQWIVKPPDLPTWSTKDFPEGPGAAEEVRGIIEMAEGILSMPEPYRTQNGSALWEFVHSNRSDAFGPNGEGWYDMRNVVEKGLDQKGLMQELFECHRRALEHPESLAAPRGWSNDPGTSH